MVGLRTGDAGAERGGLGFERGEQSTEQSTEHPLRPSVIYVGAVHLQSLIGLFCLLSNHANPSSQHL